ncbi:LacI family DNA-binding transcriptional regulator [Flavonifractor hominis]|uniref:LacI family DNA-binding transcriptional regulator n=1 Tax=Flavonifractor hominis TaxID=3133178 RepID=A0ABV1ERW7_9FIRM
MKLQNGRKIANIQDIARAAGTSIATVSRVLSNADYPVSPLLKEKVLAAAKELNYTPNLLGRMLKSNNNTAIGVVVPNLQNPFFNQVLIGIESEARRRDYELVIYSSHRDPAQERQNIMGMLQKRILGLILFSEDLSSETVEYYVASGGCVALLEANFELETVIRADTDFVEAGRIAARHLIDRGHRRIAFLTSPLTKHSRRKLLEGLKTTCRDMGVPFDEQRDVIVAPSETELDSGLYEFEQGKYLAREFLERRDGHTAIAAVNDITAYGVLQELASQKIAVPEQLSLISFDNLPFSAMLSPALTTVELPSTAMGSTACHLLIDCMEDPDGAVVSRDLVFSYPCRLRVRQSVASI